MDRDQILRDMNCRLAKLAESYRLVAMTDAGKTIFADLIDFCGQDKPSVCEQNPNDSQTNYNEGKRRVWLRIDSHIKKGKNELDKRNRGV